MVFFIKFGVPIAAILWFFIALDSRAQTPSLNQELNALEKKISDLAAPTGKADANSKNSDWIGRFTVDKESQESCALKVAKIKGQMRNHIMTLNFDNDGRDKKLAIAFDQKKEFSEWLTLTMEYIEHNRFLDRAFNFKGSLDGNILKGTFYASITRAGDSCSGDLYFVKTGTLEAKAYLENRDPRVVRLEHRLAQIQKSSKSAPVKASKDSTIALAEAVEELMRFRKMQKQEQARLAKLKAASKAQARELAALKQAQKAAQAAAQQKSARKAKIHQANIQAKRQQQQAAQSRIRKDFGTYHALIIGIDRYKNLPPLKTAIADANAVATILKRDYGFKIIKLLNPSRGDILDKLDELRAELSFDDNLLIYYSGHGSLDKKADEGYWLPVNAKINRRSRWLSNNTLTAALRAIAAKHVMVVADSCYSGRLTRGISVRPRTSRKLAFLKKLARRKARVVLTSGGLNPVDDDNGSGHSPFADALLKALRENSGIFDGTSLYKSVRRPTMVQTRNQEPQYSDVRRAGHEDGDFIFVKKGAYDK